MAMALLEKLGLSRSPGHVGRWYAPMTLDHGALGRACFAMDHQGRGQAVWEHGGSLWIQTLGPGSEASFGRLPLGQGRNPELSVNQDGWGLAAWIVDGPTERTVTGLLLDPSQGRSSGRTLFRTTGGIRHLQVAVDQGGAALVVWSHDLGGEWEILAKRFDLRSQSWDGEPTRLGRKVRHPIEPRLAMNGRGEAILVWEAEAERADGLVAAFYLPSEQQWSDHPVPIAQGRIRDYQAAVDPAGDMMILWVNQDYGQRPALEARRFSADHGDWLEPQVLATAQGFKQVHLAMNEAGEALAVWLQSEGSSSAFLHSKAFRAGAWEERVTRLDSGSGKVDEFAMALGLEGAASLFCLAQRSDGQIPLLRDRHKAWEAPVPLGKPNASPLGQPILALCAAGSVALWSMGEGQDTRLVCAQRS
jgi:hypothetical protein